MKMHIKTLTLFFIVLGLSVSLVTCKWLDLSVAWFQSKGDKEELKKSQTSKKKNKGKIVQPLKILFFEDSSLPYIRYSFSSLKGGVDFSPLEKSGLSVFTGYLLDQGAGGMSSEKIQEELNYYGTGLDVDVNRQNAEVSLSGLSQHALPLLHLFLKIILEPDFNQKEVEILRTQFIESRLKSLDSPSSVASTVFREEMFLGSELGQGGQGTIPSLKSISAEDIRSFYKEHYVKAPAVFTIVGQFTPELKKQIEDLITSSFKSIKPDSFTSKAYVSEKSEPFFSFLTKEDLVQSQVFMGHLVPRYPQENPEEYLALTLAVSALGGGQLDARLSKRIREELGLTYGVYSSLFVGRTYGIFQISGATKTETTVQFIQEALNLLNRFTQEDLVTEKELRTAKKVATGYFAKQMQTREAFVDSFFYHHYYLGLKKDFLDRYPKLIENVSLKEARSAVKKYLHPSKINLFVYGNPRIQEDLSRIRPLTKIQSFKERFAKELE